MSANSLNNTNQAPKLVTPKKRARWSRAFLLTLWTLASFIIVQLFVLAVLWVLNLFGISFSAVNEAVYNTVLAAIIYVLTLVVAVSVPLLLKRHSTSREELGLTKLPSWADIGLGPAGYVLYLLASGIIVYLVSTFIPIIDLQQAQETGFDAGNFTDYYEYLLAFATLVVIAPIAEEILFRGYLYGKLKKAVPMWAAVLITSLLFAAVHMQWNVAIDVFTLSVLACILREITGSIWAGMLLHMIKNGVAFYLLFINPSILNTMGM